MEEVSDKIGDWLTQDSFEEICKSLDALDQIRRSVPPSNTKLLLSRSKPYWDKLHSLGVPFPKSWQGLVSPRSRV